MSLSGQGSNIQCHTYQSAAFIELPDVVFDKASIDIAGISSFQYDEALNAVTIKDSITTDTIRICVRVLPTELYQPFFIRNRDTYSQVREYNDSKKVPNDQIAKPDLFEFNNVDMIGAISRGITVGNNQDLVVNSALNLQIDGKLSDNLLIQANISDQNIPFQPEGNTQQIRDFDNIFIKLYNENHSLTAGDLVAKNPFDESYFLQYRKNVQGLEGLMNYDLNDNWSASTLGLISIAKGQFTSSMLEPTEGIQGPYRLRGANDERFIIVLAGSEKVYLDGQLLERGFDRDYTIDYNQSEITFSNRILITRFSRIRVDFEYADQFFGRTNLNVAQSFESKDTKIYLNFYQEKDNPNNPFGFENDQENIAQLSMAGDNTLQSFISGVDSIGLVRDAILYAKKDTIFNSSTFEIYQYTPLSDSNFYQISFTEVSFGQGNYILKNTSANGQIYEWIAPLNRQSQGNFIPEIRVNTPNKRQVSIIGATHQLTKYDKLFTEIALSNTDLNLYSNLDDEDNNGVAFKAGYVSAGRPLKHDYKFDAGLSIEHNSSNFQPIDRFRSIEYDRDWSYNSLTDTISREDNIFSASIGLNRKAYESFSYTLSIRERTEVIEGIKHQLGFSYQFGDFLIKSNAFFLNSVSNNTKANWMRSSHEVRFKKWLLQPGYMYVTDRHQESTLDSVRFSLMNFASHNFYIQTSDTSKIRTRIDFTTREDRLPVSGELQDYTKSKELRWTLGTSQMPNQNIDINFTYREVDELLVSKKEKNFLAFTTWNSRFLDNSLVNNIQYSTSNTRELKRTFIYLQVPSGQGTHTWRDENNDGIQDINEFYESVNSDEREYAKIFTPTDEYITAFQTTYIQTLDLKAPSSWHKKSSWLPQKAAKLAINAHLNINSKTTDNSLARLNPFNANSSDTTTVFLRSNRRFSAFYNRNASGLAADFTINNQDSKSLLSNGFERREKVDRIFNIRLPISSTLIFRARSSKGEITSSSDFLDSRNYEIAILGTEPAFVWQPSDKLRLTTNIRYDYKSTSDKEDNIYSRITSMGANLDFIRSGKGTMNVGFQWVSIDFEGEEQSALGYELLEALRPGANQRWNINWQQNIKSGLQMSLIYNGRNSENQRVIHTGSMSLTAFF